MADGGQNIEMADLGERIATLEARYEEVVSRLNHLDTCIDGVRAQAAENAYLVRKNSQVWDDRWSFGKGVFWSVSAIMAILGTIGLVRLNEIFNILSHLK